MNSGRANITIMKLSQNRRPQRTRSGGRSRLFAERPVFTHGFSLDEQARIASFSENVAVNCGIVLRFFGDSAADCNWLQCAGADNKREFHS